MRLLLVDDHTLFREALIHILEQLDENIVVLESGGTQQAHALLSQYPDLDLILWDLGLPKGGGITGLKAIIDAAPTIPVIVVSATNNVADIEQSMVVGAMGFIHKTATAHETTSIIKQVLAGDISMPTALLQRVHTADASDSTASVDLHSDAVTLTLRQQEVLSLLAQGLPNKLIADRMSVSEGTVKLHVYAVFRALGSRNRTEAVLEGVRRGMVTLPSS